MKERERSIKKAGRMKDIKEIENGIKNLNAKIDFYLKMEAEAVLLGIKELIDFEHYL